MKFCYVLGEQKRLASAKAWETRRQRYGPKGGNRKGPRDQSYVTDAVRKSRRDASLASWKNPEQRARRISSLQKVRSKISETLKRKYANGYVHWAYTDKYATVCENMSKACLKKWAKFKTSDGYAEWKQNLLRSHYRRPSGLERKVMNLHIPSLEYTGDSNFWIHLKSKSKNPDFVLRPFRETKTVVEVFGAMGYYHTEEEIPRLVSEYADVGITCLILREEEFKDMDSLEKKILKLVHLKLGYIGETPTPKNGQEDNPEERLVPKNEPLSVEIIRRASSTDDDMIRSLQ